ncbi:MAG: c-type cytochrome, partial [Planctomycetales bacterium]|nr:c-type cytochrome [Planctomycetales bacterium]
AMARQFVPESDKILVSSRLLQPGESQAISFEAPTKPGVYPIVCTFPGHWRRMYAALYVVEDLDAYRADPAAYLASAKLPIEDELLKLIGQSREWTIDELIEFVQPLETGRSFEVGQNAFKVASCISCHKMGVEGQQIGPELTKLDPMKRNAEHILRSLIAPSEKIDEKFQPYVFELASGQIVTGMIIEETANEVKVIENPLAKADPIVIVKDDIDFRQKSATSIMPLGLASKLTREEILDLVAFVLAGGDKKNAIFERGHNHHELHEHHGK